MNNFDLAAVKFDENGLIPAVVQDADSKRVLMLAYVNQEALQLTIETKLATFWSRSRQKIWVKGATSSNTQHVVEIQLDCDGDTLLFLVHPSGPACHNGTTSCFDTAHLQLGIDA